MKKRTILMALLLLAGLALMGIFWGKTAFVRRETGESSRFSRQEILDAMDLAEDAFRSHFDGCILLEISYEESWSERYAPDWAETYGEEEGIVFLSRFVVGPSGVAGGFNPNSVYDRWQWVLTRSGKGPWELRTWGYG